jgi:hypothetical protein
MPSGFWVPDLRSGQQMRSSKLQQGTAFDSRWVPPPVGGAPSRRTGTGGATTGLLSPVPEATQVLGTRESGSVPSGSQAKSSGAVNQQQAARQPGEAMSSGASGWVSSQPRRCAGRPAGAHRRGEEPPDEVNGFLLGVLLQEHFNGPLWSSVRAPYKKLRSGFR